MSKICSICLRDCLQQGNNKIIHYTDTHTFVKLILKLRLINISHSNTVEIILKHRSLYSQLLLPSGNLCTQMMLKQVSVDPQLNPWEKVTIIFIDIDIDIKATQSCPTLCDSMDCSLPRSTIHGIFQARVLEWIAISFSRGSSQPRDRTQVSCIVGRRFTI